MLAFVLTIASVPVCGSKDFRGQLALQIRNQPRNKNATEFVPGRAPEEGHTLLRHDVAPSDNGVREMDVRITSDELHVAMSKAMGPQYYEKNNFAWTQHVSDPCPFPRVPQYDSRGNFRMPDGLTDEWDWQSYCNPPFTTMSQWARKALTEFHKGKEIVFLCPSHVRDHYEASFLHIVAARPWYRNLLNAGGVELPLRSDGETHGEFWFDNPNYETSGCEAKTLVDVVAIHLNPHRFANPATEMADPSITPCKYHQKGVCRRGESCHFLHQPKENDKPAPWTFSANAEEFVPQAPATSVNQTYMPTGVEFAPSLQNTGFATMVFAVPVMSQIPTVVSSSASQQ